MSHITSFALTAAILGASAINVLADGSFVFFGSTFTSSVWENFSTEDFQRSAGTVKVTFFWGAPNSVPAVDSILMFTPTNLVPAGPPPWSIVLNDPAFTQAIDSSTGLPAISNTGLTGGYSYNSSSPFPVTGTTGLSTYTVYVIGWDGQYATPQAAAAAGSPLGWSNPVQYVAGTDLIPPATFSNSGILPFGVNVPEPTACSVVALGVAMLFAARRR